MREDGHRYTFTVPDLPWKREESDDPLPALVPPSPDVRDEVDKPCCCVCGKVVSQGKNQVWVCVDCRKEHSLPMSMTEWPAWARFLATTEQARRRENMRSAP